MTYEEYECKCAAQRRCNAKYLEIFEKELLAAGLISKTIRKHMENVDFYINEYLLRQPLEMSCGCAEINEFLGYFFIHKCMWSTPENIKTTAASIKKFYKCMMEHAYVTKEDYQNLCEDIKENMSVWQRDCARFNDEW